MPHATRSSFRRGTGSSGRPHRPSSRPQPAAKPVDELERAFSAAVQEPDAVAPAFSSFELPQRLVDALDRRGMQTAFPIQARTLPDALAGRDVLGRAQTGSGKTLGFGLPLLARLDGASSAPGRPRGLVLVPTRELAQQVHDALEPLASAVGLRVCAVYGGASMYRQVQALRRGSDIVIATPGRLLDLISQGECSLTAVTMTVLDEADYMADLGFLPVVTQLLEQTKEGGQRLLFSATLDKGVSGLVRRFLDSPVIHAVAPAVSPVTSMDHRAFAVRHEDRLDIVTRIGHRPGRTLIFVRTKRGADRLAQQLRKGAVEAVAIHGDLGQGARQRALDDFTSGRSRVLVATDVAARGIHVDDLSLVVHYDPPADVKDYMHRSGRTARAGAAGVVLSLITPDQRRDATSMFAEAGVTVTLQPCSVDAADVHELATSGEVIVAVPAAPMTQRSSGGGGRSRRSGSGGGRRYNRPRSEDRRSAA